MMGVLRWRLLVCACTIASRRSVTQLAGCRKKKIAASLKAVAPAACERLAGHGDAVATTAERLPLPGSGKSDPGQPGARHRSARPGKVSGAPCADAGRDRPPGTACGGIRAFLPSNLHLRHRIVSVRCR